MLKPPPNQLAYNGRAISKSDFSFTHMKKSRTAGRVRQHTESKAFRQRINSTRFLFFLIWNFFSTILTKEIWEIKNMVRQRAKRGEKLARLSHRGKIVWKWKSLFINMKWRIFFQLDSVTHSRQLSFRVYEMESDVFYDVIKINDHFHGEFSTTLTYTLTRPLLSTPAIAKKWQRVEKLKKPTKLFFTNLIHHCVTCDMFSRQQKSRKEDKQHFKWLKKTERAQVRHGMTFAHEKKLREIKEERRTRHLTFSDLNLITSAAEEQLHHVVWRDDTMLNCCED